MTPQSTCKNCNHPLTDTAKYCPNCGQKNIDKTISLFTLIGDYINNAFALDGTLVNTIKLILSPGALTKSYFDGKHKSTYSPFRLFLVSSLCFFTLSLPLIPNFNEFYNDDFEFGFPTKEKIQLQETYISTIDSARMDEKLSKVTIDSLNQKIIRNVFKGKMSSTININSKSVKLKDFIDLPEDEFIAKYYEETTLLTRLTYKISKNLFHVENIRDFFIKKIALSIIMTIIGFAFFLKLLYIRRKKYYVEHFVFSLHTHSVALLLFTIANLAILAGAHQATMFIIAGIVATLYTYGSIKKYYEQSHSKSFLKFSIATIAYIFVLTISISLLFVYSLVYA